MGYKIGAPLDSMALLLPNGEGEGGGCSGMFAMCWFHWNPPACRQQGSWAGQGSRAGQGYAS